MCMYKAQAPGGPARKRGAIKKSRVERNEDGDTLPPIPHPLLPFSPSPGDFFQVWGWQNLAQEREDDDSPGLWRSLRKSEEAGTPSVTLQSLGFQMGTVTIFSYSCSMPAHSLGLVSTSLLSSR